MKKKLTLTATLTASFAFMAAMLPAALGTPVELNVNWNSAAPVEQAVNWNSAVPVEQAVNWNSGPKRYVNWNS